MTPKETVSKNAWIAEIGEEKYNEVKDKINEIYCLPEDVVKSIDEKLIHTLEPFQDLRENWFYRPESLEGIENNNGWNRIDEVGLPSEKGEYWIADTLNGIVTKLFDPEDKTDVLFFINQVTHYQPIIKPNPPLY